MDPPAWIYLKCMSRFFFRGEKGYGKIKRGFSPPPCQRGRMVATSNEANKKQFSKELVIPADSNPLAHLEDRRRIRAGKEGPVVHNLHPRITFKVSAAAITCTIAPC